jgi:hypothetical protein
MNLSSTRRVSRLLNGIATRLRIPAAVVTNVIVTPPLFQREGLPVMRRNIVWHTSSNTNGFRR